jgi:hypothetical protein
MLDLKSLVERFFFYIGAEDIEIYNEFSFQHELA